MTDKSVLGTDVSSLVPMDLSEEPADYVEPAEAGSDSEVAVVAPDADLSGDPVTDDAISDDIEFDDAADLAFLQAVGDRGTGEHY